MKYKDYMDLFTVSPEIKSSVFNGIKQREKQIGTQTAENHAESIAPTPKIKNTFKLHIKRWIAIATSLVLLAVLTPIIYFSVPKNNDRPDDVHVSFSLGYMKNLMIDVDGVTAYSIRKNLNSTRSSGAGTVKKSISLLSAELSDRQKGSTSATEPKFYLYSTNENYEYGNVEYDSNGIQKVTFVKNTEIDGDVYDDSGNIIDSNRKITQDEINGQVNKIFTTKEYTYIQFVALVGSSGEYPYMNANGNIYYEYVNVRPEGMTYDENGVAEFDMTDYYSSNLTASFVIDNSTGYIYKIENLHIKSFHNGLVVSNNGYYYLISTDENHNLIFTDVLPNKDVSVIDVIMDKYGWLFLVNDRINSVDSERKVLYTTELKKYAFDRDYNVYVWNYSDPVGYYRVTHKMVDGKEEPYKNHGFLNLTLLYDSTNIVLYKDLTVKSVRKSLAYNPDTDCGLFVDSRNPEINTYWGISTWFDNNYDMIIAHCNNALYYATVDLNDYVDKKVTLYVEDDFTQFADFKLFGAENYYMSVGNDRYKINNVCYRVSANETAYYRIVRTTTGLELVELTSKSYRDNVFIFQPINK